MVVIQVKSLTFCKPSSTPWIPNYKQFVLNWKILIAEWRTLKADRDLWKNKYGSQCHPVPQLVPVLNWIGEESVLLQLSFR